MVQNKLLGSEPRGCAVSLSTFRAAYVEALYFTDGQGLDNDEFDAGDELSPEANEQIDADCKAFYEANEQHITDDACRYSRCSPAEYAGHDFWLTRNGHGCGFWDGDWTEPQATALDDAAKAFGEVSAYKGDDGLVYLS
jgi:hypothetical protein